MQVTNSPVQKIAAAAATRQSVSIGLPPSLIIAVLRQLWGDYSKQKNGCQFEGLPIRPRWEKPNPLAYFSP